MTLAQRAGLGVRGEGLNLAGCARSGAHRISHVDIVDGNKLAGSQKSGHDKADGRDQKKLARFAELHALPSSWAIRFKPQEFSFRLPRMYCKTRYGVQRLCLASAWPPLNFAACHAESQPRR